MRRGISTNRTTGMSWNSGGLALSFSAASSQHVELGNVLGFERTDTRSFSFWAKWTANSNGTFFSKQDSTARGWEIFTDTSAAGCVFFAILAIPTYLSIRTTAAYNDGLWHHFAITYSGNSLASGVVIYVDGSSVAITIASNNLAAATITNSVSAQIGARYATGSRNFLTGDVTEIAVWDSVLTAAQVVELYNSGRPKDARQHTQFPHLLGYWPLGAGDCYPLAIDRSAGGHNGTMTNMSTASIVKGPA